VRVAYQLGQQKPGGAGRAGFVALVLGGLFMLGSAVVLWTVPRLLIGFYVDLADPGNQALIAIALQLFVIAALFQLFDGVQVIASGALRGYRDTTIPMVIAAIGYWAIGFAGGWLLAFPVGLGATGLWAGLAVGLAIVAVALTVRLNSLARRHSRDAVRTTLAPSESAAIRG
jgi:MATE family multidrug resistance protein